eukprot:3455681-Rhodomonas_salina.3
MKCAALSYALSGTDLAYGLYAMSGTDLAHGRTLSPFAVLTSIALRACYAMSGTDIAYGAPIVLDDVRY